MKRTRLNKPTCILTGDWHLRETQPICRTDNYWEAQWKKVDFITDLQKRYDCIVIHSGDLFDHWKPSPNLLRETIEHIPNRFYTIYGNHDLPQHNLELVDKCGINVLEAGNHLTVLQYNKFVQSSLRIDGLHWGQEPEKNTLANRRNVLVWHILTYQDKPPWFGCPAPMAGKLLRKYPQFNLIVSGDNHKSFVEEYQGRLLVNPGSLMRMDADQVNHKPCIYLWYAEDNSIKQVFLPIKENVISRTHLDQKKERDGRIDAFVSRLDSNWEVKLSFEDNLERFFETNNTIEPIKEIIYKSIET